MGVHCVNCSFTLSHCALFFNIAPVQVTTLHYASGYVILCHFSVAYAHLYYLQTPYINIFINYPKKLIYSHNQMRHRRRIRIFVNVLSRRIKKYITRKHAIFVAETWLSCRCSVRVVVMENCSKTNCLGGSDRFPLAIKFSMHKNNRY